VDKSFIKSIHLGIVCPMANEQNTAANFTKEVLYQCDRFEKLTFFAIFDNSCTDKTLEILRRLSQEDERVTVIWAPENKCVVDAYRRGYMETLQAGCDWILEIDAGYSHQPSDFIQFFEKLNNGNYDCIFGSRFCKNASLTDTSWKRYLMSKGGTILSNWLLGTTLTDMTSGYQLFRREALQNILSKGIKSRAHFFQTEIKAYCRNMNVAEVPIHYKAPSSSVNLKIVFDAFNHLARLFKMRLSGTL
jgi:dolichol-phosphate mannosyltransferase